MEKINFENLPSTNTPVNASNLNQLQTNVENAINGTSWVDIPYANTYSSYSESSLNKLQCRKINNQVFIRGMIKSSTSNPIGYNATCGVLSNEFKPQKAVYFICNEDNVPCNCSVESNGEIRVFNKVANDWISLDGMFFFVD